MSALGVEYHLSAKRIHGVKKALMGLAQNASRLNKKPPNYSHVKHAYQLVLIPELKITLVNRLERRKERAILGVPIKVELSQLAS